ncbi:hypothetical protein [Pseudidiomarina aestuarii]|uniref:hypothetical protein n=1 Tax=Pseudidiomarina aestuarii TaxID=624146 RepID=UPI003A979363
MRLRIRPVLSVALASSFVPVAVAADIATQTLPLKVSSQYFQVAPAGKISTNDMIVTLGAEYAEDDTLIFSFSGTDSLDISSLPTFLTLAADGPNGKKGMTVGLLAQERINGRTLIYYRVTNITGGESDTTTGITLNFGSIDFEALRSQQGIDVRFSARSNAGLPLDNFTTDNTSQVLIEATEQFVSTVIQPLDQEVDFENDRQTFLGGVTSDVLEFRIESDPTLDIGVDVDGVVYEVFGDFSWVKDTSPNIANIQPMAGVFTLTDLSGTANCSNVLVAADRLRFSCDTLDTLTLAIETAAQGSDVVIPTSEFEILADVDFSVAGGTFSASEVGPIAAGEWTLNAAQTYIPYMPYSRQGVNQFSQIIYVNNVGDQSSEVSIDVYTEDGRRISLSNDELMGLTAETGITKLTGPIYQAIAARGLLFGGSDVKSFAFNIVVNDLDENVEVFSSFNDSGRDRGFVQNDSIVINRNKY